MWLHCNIVVDRELAKWNIRNLRGCANRELFVLRVKGKRVHGTAASCTPCPFKPHRTDTGFAKTKNKQLKTIMNRRERSCEGSQDSVSTCVLKSAAIQRTLQAKEIHSWADSADEGLEVCFMLRSRLYRCSPLYAFLACSCQEACISESGGASPTRAVTLLEKYLWFQVSWVKNTEVVGLIMGHVWHNYLTVFSIMYTV
jgi:hypothetical protein